MPSTDDLSEREEMADATKETEKPEEKRKLETNWPRVLLQLHIHAFFVYGFIFLFKAKLFTVVFTIFLTFLGLLGATAGAHRLWAHQSYSAKVVLKIFLMLCQTLAGNGPIYDWVLDHRIHHKYHGTNDDPYNYKRGFLYAHIGNRLCNPDPRRAELEKEIDMSDLESDRVVMLQKKFYWIIMPVITFLLPINAPVEYWGEDMLVSAMVLIFFRLPALQHAVWLINSGRSVWGLEPNDRFFSESNLVFILKKSHWHEYHYTVPWDCLTGEFGSYDCGCTTGLIKIWTVMGLADNMKTINSKGMTMALERALDTGKPIAECLQEARDEIQLYRYEDDLLGLYESKETRPF